MRFPPRGGLRAFNLKVSLIIPAYNEAERLGAALAQILAYAADRKWDSEVLVVNDGSRDSTAQIARSFAQHNPTVRLLENPGNRGKGYAVRHGMSAATGDLLLFTDADLSSPIAESEKLFAAIAAGADVAIGSRWLNSALQTHRQPRHRQFLGRAFNLALRLFLGLKEKDTQCGFKAFNRRAASTIFPRQRIERWGFDPEILFLAHRFKLVVAEVPVEWGHDHRSTIHPFRDGLRMFAELLAIRRNAIIGRYR